MNVMGSNYLLLGLGFGLVAERRCPQHLLAGKGKSEDKYKYRLICTCMDEQEENVIDNYS